MDDLARLELEAEVARLRLEHARLRGGLERVAAVAAPHVVDAPSPAMVAILGRIRDGALDADAGGDCVDDPEASPPTFWTVGQHNHQADGQPRDYNDGCPACNRYWERAAVWRPPPPTAAELREDRDVKLGVAYGDGNIEPDPAPDPEIDPGRRAGFR